MPSARAPRYSKSHSYYVKKHPGLAEGVSGSRRSHPESPYESDAWMLKKDDGSCPRGSHEAPAYKKLHTTKYSCVRNCAAWKPKRKTGKGGACYKPRRGGHRSVWMMMMDDARALNKRVINSKEGVAKKNLMVKLMKHTGGVYRRYFPASRDPSNDGSKYSKLRNQEAYKSALRV